MSEQRFVVSDILWQRLEPHLPADLPPGRPSVITRVLGFDSRRFPVWQARQARCHQIAQALGPLLLGSCCRGMSAA
jgi:hypothetical protein